MKSTRTAILRRLEALYTRMAQGYEAAAQGTGFTCTGCTQNCCTSHFQHHTYAEWLYFFKGLDALPAPRREQYMDRARACVRETHEALARGERPAVMCPVNDDGLCGMYAHRLMICRLHGVPHLLAGRDGLPQAYPGCHRFPAGGAAAPLDRTPLYRDLARIEMDLLGARLRSLPRVNLTLAEMMVQGPPRLTP